MASTRTTRRNQSKQPEESTQSAILNVEAPSDAALDQHDAGAGVPTEKAAAAINQSTVPQETGKTGKKKKDKAATKKSADERALEDQALEVSTVAPTG